MSLKGKSLEMARMEAFLNVHFVKVDCKDWASDRWSDDRGAVSTVLFRCRSRTGRTPDLD